MATRTAARPTAGAGAAGAGARPFAAAAPTVSSCDTTSASSRPPTTSAPRDGSFGTVPQAPPDVVTTANPSVAPSTGPLTVVRGTSAEANDMGALSDRCRPGTYS